MAATGIWPNKRTIGIATNFYTYADGLLLTQTALSE